MNPYIEKIKTYLNKSSDAEPITEQLYRCYRESHPMDTEPISKEFGRLDAVLRELPLRDCDCVWDISCRLCALHEQEGFKEGARVGMRLVLELAEET